MNNTQTMGFYAVIPSFVLESEIEPNAKLLYGHISALCNKEGFCWASNAYFANKFTKKGAPVDVRTVKRWVASLVQYGFIISNIQYEEDGKTVLRRCLSIPFQPVTTQGQKNHGGDDEKRTTPNDEIVTQNNTGIINTSDNYIKLDDVVNDNAGARDENGKIDVEMWITSNLKAIRHPEFHEMSCKACYKNTDVLEYVCEVLDEILKDKSPIRVKGVVYEYAEIADLIRNMSSTTFCYLTQGFYAVDEDAHRFIRKHVSDPIAYMVTILINIKNTPLKKVGTAGGGY